MPLDFIAEPEETLDFQPESGAADLDFQPESVPPAQGLMNAARRGILGVRQTAPAALAAAGRSQVQSVPTPRQKYLGFESAMTDPEYMLRLMSAPDDATARLVESAFGPTGRAEQNRQLANTGVQGLRDVVVDLEAQKRAIPQSEVQRNLATAEGAGEKWAVFRKNPVQVVSSIVAESLPPSIAGAAIGAPAGPGGMAAGAGMASGLTEFSHTLISEAEQAGFNPAEADSFNAFLDSDQYDAAVNKALVRGAIIGGVDAATMGYAGTLVKPALREGLKQVVKAGLKETGVQMAGGAGGELGAQGATLKPGEKLDWFDISMEALAEGATAGPEAGAKIGGTAEGRAALRRALAEAVRPKAEPEAPLQPGDRISALGAQPGSDEDNAARILAVRKALEGQAVESKPADVTPEVLEDLQAVMRGERPESGRLKQRGQTVSAAGQTVSAPKENFPGEREEDAKVRALLDDRTKNYAGMTAFELEMLESLGDLGARSERKARMVRKYQEGEEARQTPSVPPSFQPPTAETITGPDERTGSEMPAEAAGVATAQAPVTTAAPQEAIPPTRRRPRSTYTNERPHDLIDEIEGSVGKIDPKLIREANPNWRPIGAARKLFRKGGRPADTALNAVTYEGNQLGLAPDTGLQEFGDAINDAASARKGQRETAAREKRLLDAVAKEATQEGQFKQKALYGERPASQRGNVEQVHVDALVEGDTFRVQNHEFTVEALELDDDGRLLSVQVKDGPKFGVQEVDGTETMYVDRGSLKGGSPLVEPTAKQGGSPLVEAVGEELRMTRVAPFKVNSKLFVGEFRNSRGGFVGFLYKTGDAEWHVYDLREFSNDVVESSSRPLARSDFEREGGLALTGGQTVRHYRLKQHADGEARANLEGEGWRKWRRELDGQQVRDAIEDLRVALPGAPQVVIVGREAQLPSGIRSFLPQEKGARGVFSNGRVYLVAENLRDAGEARMVYLHEALGHYGLRAVLGDKLNPFLESVARKYEGTAQWREVERLYGKDRLTNAEEIVARIAEGGIEDAPLWQRIVRVVQAWWRKLTGGNISEGEIRAVLQQAAERLRGGASREGAKGAKAEFSLADDLDAAGRYLYGKEYDSLTPQQQADAETVAQGGIVKPRPPGRVPAAQGEAARAGREQPAREASAEEASASGEILAGEDEGGEGQPPGLRRRLTELGERLRVLRANLERHDPTSLRWRQLAGEARYIEWQMDALQSVGREFRDTGTVRFSLQEGGEFSFDAPESVTEQKARREREQAQADAKTRTEAQRDELARKRDRRLAGDLGDAGQGGLFAEEGQQEMFRNTAAQTTPETKRVQADNGELLGPALFSLTAYHGTPHDVDRFSTAKVGTGEGAQVYGWGLYFAENPEVSKTYRHAGRSDLKKVEISDRARELFAKTFPDGVPPIAKIHGMDLESLASFTRSKTGVGQQIRDSLPRELVEEFDRAPERGNEYTVSIDVERDELLDWDKPIGNQSESIRRALKPYIELYGNATTGAELYRRMSAPERWGAEVDSFSERGPQAASRFLSGQGIPGIRYLDQGSRLGGIQRIKQNLENERATLAGFEAATARGESVLPAIIEMRRKYVADLEQALADAEAEPKPTYNYVLFDDSKITITHKNGQRVTMAEAAQPVRFSLSPDDRNARGFELTAEARRLREAIQAERDLERKADLQDELDAVSAELDELITSAPKPRGGIPKAAHAFESDVDGNLKQATAGAPGYGLRVPAFEGPEKLPAGRLRDLFTGLRSWRQRTGDWLARRGARADITVGRDAGDNRAAQVANHGGNSVRVRLNRAFGSTGDAVRRKHDLREYALTFVIEADGDRAKLGEFHTAIADSEHADTKHGRRALAAVRYAETHWDKFSDAAGWYNTLTEAERETELNEGINSHEWKGGYVFHQWQKAAAGAAVDPTVPQPAGTPFRKPRSVATVAEGIAQGRIPVTLNAVESLAARLDAGQKRLNELRWVHGLRKFNDPVTDEPVVVDVIRKPRKPINTRATSFEEEPAFEEMAKPEWVTSAPEGYSVWKQGDIEVAVADGFKGLLNDLTSASFFKGNKLKKTFGLMKSMLLMFDTFHLGRMAAWRTMFGGWSAGFKGYKRGLTLLDYTEGDLREMAARGEIPEAWVDGLAENKRQLDLAVASGFNIGNVLDNAWGDALHHMPLVGTFNKWLFGQYQRGAMAESWLIEFARNRRARPNESEAQTARRVSRDLNARFGNLNRQGVWKSRTMQDFVRFAFLAPQWNESLIRAELGAVRDLFRLPMDSVKQRRLVVGTLLKATGTMALGTFLVNQVLNLLFRGKPTWENDEEGWDKKLSGYVPDVMGDGPGFFLNPLALPAEYTHLIDTQLHKSKDGSDATWRIINSRLSNPARALMTLATRRDVLGRAVRPGEVTEAMGNALTPLPIPTSTVVGAGRQIITGEPSEKYPGQFQKQAMASFGIKTDQAPSPEQRIRNLARDFNKARGIVPSAEFYTGDFDEFTKALRIGNDTDARDALEELLRKKTRRQVYDHFVNWQRAPFTGQRARESEFLRGLTPEQRTAYDASRKTRRALARKSAEMLRAAAQTPAVR